LAILSELFTLVGDSAILNKFNLTIKIPYEDQLPFAWFQNVKGALSFGHVHFTLEHLLKVTVHTNWIIKISKDCVKNYQAILHLVWIILQRLALHVDYILE
jgi:hypothetical protein